MYSHDLSSQSCLFHSIHCDFSNAGISGQTYSLVLSHTHHIMLSDNAYHVRLLVFSVQLFSRTLCTWNNVLKPLQNLVKIIILSQKEQFFWLLISHPRWISQIRKSSAVNGDCVSSVQHCQSRICCSNLQKTWGFLQCLKTSRSHTGISFTTQKPWKLR